MISPVYYNPRSGVQIFLFRFNKTSLKRSKGTLKESLALSRKGSKLYIENLTILDLEVTV